MLILAVTFDWRNNGVVEYDFRNIYSQQGTTYLDVCNAWQAGTDSPIPNNQFTVGNQVVRVLAYEVGRRVYDFQNTPGCNCVLINGFYAVSSLNPANTFSRGASITVYTIIDCIITAINTCPLPPSQTPTVTATPLITPTNTPTPTCVRPGGLTSIYYANRLYQNTVNGLPAGGPYNFGVTSNQTSVGCQTYNQYFQQWSPNGCPVAIFVGGSESACGGGLVDVTNYNTLYNFNESDVNSPAYYPFTQNVSTFYTNGSTSCGCGNFAGNANMWINATNPFQPITNSSGVWTIRLDPSTCKVIEMNKCSTAPPTPQLLLKNIAGQNPIQIQFGSTGVGGSKPSNMTASINWNDFPGGSIPVVGPLPTTSTWSVGNANSPLIPYTYTNTDSVKTLGVTFINNPSTFIGVYVNTIKLVRVSEIVPSSINPFTFTLWSNINRIDLETCSIVNFNGLTYPPNLTQLVILTHLSTTFNLSWAGNMTNLQNFQFVSSTFTTTLNFNFSNTILTSGANTLEGYGSPRLVGNSVLTSLTLTLPSSVNTLNILTITGNQNLSTLTINGNVATGLSSYTALREIYVYANSIEVWPFENFNSTNNITIIYMNLNTQSTNANRGFSLGFKMNFTNLIVLSKLRLQDNKISNSNSPFTNFANCVKLTECWLFNNLLTFIPSLPVIDSALNLDLRFYRNLLNTNTNPTCIPPLPIRTQTLYAGYTPSTNFNGTQETNIIPSWPTTVTLNNTNINTFYCQGVSMTSWPSTISFPTGTSNLIIYLELNQLTTWDFSVCTNAKQVWLNRQQSSNGLTLFLATLQNVNLATTMNRLEANFNAVDDPQKFFYPLASANSRFFPPSLIILNIRVAPILPANQPWSKNLFAFGVVNSITTVNLQNMSLTSASVNFILDHFYKLCTTTPAGAATTIKSQSCAPNLTTISIDNTVISTISASYNNQPPTAPANGPNGIIAKTQLNSIGVLTPNI